MKFIKRFNEYRLAIRQVMFRARRYRITGRLAPELPSVLEYVRVLEGMSIFKARCELNRVRGIILQSIGFATGWPITSATLLDVALDYAPANCPLGASLVEVIILEHMLFPSIETEVAVGKLTAEHLAWVTDYAIAWEPLFSDRMTGANIKGRKPTFAPRAE